LIALHPGSGSAKKNWPLEKWLALGEALFASEANSRLLVIGGEADHVALTVLASAWKNRPVLFAENLPLPHVAAILERASLFIGHDSGISHIAAAVGVPCVLMFGPTDPDVWAPVNSKVRVLHAPDGALENLTLETVIAAAKETLLASAPGLNLF
jgi:heptosyltransferase-2